MEIIVRAVVLFVFLSITTRVAGRATLGELSTFQLLLYVTMGDLVQQAITQQDYSITSGVLAISVFALLTIVISWVNGRWARWRPLTHGTPVMIMRSGEPLLDTMRRERLSIDDLMAAAREKGIRRISQVDPVVLETDGKISFFTDDTASAGAPDRPSVG
jgi:uncharacterized membrane protein YcaP (DUF421 family)